MAFCQLQSLHELNPDDKPRHRILGEEMLQNIKEDIIFIIAKFRVSFENF